MMTFLLYFFSQGNVVFGYPQLAHGGVIQLAEVV